jgi:hypothetical protein
MFRFEVLIKKIGRVDRIKCSRGITARMPQQDALSPRVMGQKVRNLHEDALVTRSDGCQWLLRVQGYIINIAMQDNPAAVFGLVFLHCNDPMLVD